MAPSRIFLSMLAGPTLALGLSSFLEKGFLSIPPKAGNAWDLLGSGKAPEGKDEGGSGLGQKDCYGVGIDERLLRAGDELDVEGSHQHSISLTPPYRRYLYGVIL